MEFGLTIVLVDSDTRRRAEITHALSNSNRHVEPFESIAELSNAWPQTGFILLNDEKGAVAKLIDAMARHGNWFPIIAFSDDANTARIVEAILDGAIDYMAWPIDSDELTTTLDRAQERAHRFGNARLREVMARARIDKLTRREREVLTGVASGLSNRLIGEKLAISPRTVEIHRANMLNKLGAHHSSEAIRLAIEADLAD